MKSGKIPASNWLAILRICRFSFKNHNFKKSKPTLKYSINLAFEKLVFFVKFNKREEIKCRDEL